MKASLRRSRPSSRAAGFSILELIVVILVIGILLGAGSVGISSSAVRVRQEAEAQRLLGTLRWLRELARSSGKYADPAAPVGYGLFFWRNAIAVSATPPSGPVCFEYSIYSPVNQFVPNANVNLVSANAIMGTPDTPFTMVDRTSSETAYMASQGLQDAISGGYRIYFQTDTPGQPRREPDAVRNTPPSAPGGTGWNGFRIVFWPPGYDAPAVWTPPASERGVTLPKFPNSPGGIYYNRIYIESSADKPNDAITPWLPYRIHIDPGTGISRMMPSTERRLDGTW